MKQKQILLWVLVAVSLVMGVIAFINPKGLKSDAKVLSVGSASLVRGLGGPIASPEHPNCAELRSDYAELLNARNYYESIDDWDKAEEYHNLLLETVRTYQNLGCQGSITTLSGGGTATQ